MGNVARHDMFSLSPTRFVPFKCNCCWMRLSVCRSDHRKSHGKRTRAAKQTTKKVEIKRAISSVAKQMAKRNSATNQTREQKNCIRSTTTAMLRLRRRRRRCRLRLLFVRTMTDFVAAPWWQTDRHRYSVFGERERARLFLYFLLLCIRFL